MHREPFSVNAHPTNVERSKKSLTFQGILPNTMGFREGIRKVSETMKMM